MEEREVALFLLSTTAVLLIMVIAIVYVVLSYRNRRKVYALEKKQMNEQFQREVESARAEMQQSLMKQIGAELHDTVGQKLTLAYLQAQNLQSEDSLLIMKEKLQSHLEHVQHALNDLRSLSKLLNAEEVLKSGFARLIERELRFVQQAGLCHTHFDCPNPPPRLPDQRAEIVMAGICREFIQNSLKHSGCKNIWFTLQKNGSQIKIELRDDGKGMTPTGSDAQPFDIGNQGLRNIEHRASLVNSRLSWHTAPQGGVSLRIEL